MSYREYIGSLKSKWVGRTVLYAGHDYEVVDVDYNGALLINKPAQFTATTAICEQHLDIARPACYNRITERS